MPEPVKGAGRGDFEIFSSKPEQNTFILQPEIGNSLSRSTLEGATMPWLHTTTQLATTGRKQTGAKANSENIIIQRPA